jgi:hypothetical protein
MIRMADKHHPLRKFHKQQTKPRRAFNLISFVCECEGNPRMRAASSHEHFTWFKCQICGRRKKIARGS